jgi:hypothetical protein
MALLKIHTIEAKIYSRKSPTFLIGRVRYDTKTPEDYEIKPVAKGKTKILIGTKGIYILNDKMTEEIISRVWENYLKERKGNRNRKEGIVEHPVEVIEDEVRNYFCEKGIVPMPETGWINFSYEIPDFEKMRKSILEIVKEVKRKVVKE